MASGATELEAGRLYALSNRYELDGRVTWHPPAARGFAPLNCYLLVEPEEALLIDTGLTVHRAALLEQLEAALPEGTPLSILFTRLGEYSSICNAPAVAARFDVQRVYGQHAGAPLWTDFEPAAGEGFGHSIGDTGETVLLGSQYEVAVGTDGRRPLQVFSAALRLLPTYWIYDEATRTLFTSDSFSHVGEGEPDGGLEAVREHMLETRYWWLAGADAGPIAAEVAAVFDRHPVERIAPQYGCVIEGREAVERELAHVLAVVEGSDGG